MAITETITGYRASIKLEDGTLDSGAIKTVSVSFPTLNPSSKDSQKLLNIAQAAEDIFSKDLYEVTTSTTTTLSTQE